MVAAENDALPGAKVGGVGDVIRDLPSALQSKGADVTVVLPSYGFLRRMEHIELIRQFNVQFAGESHMVELFRVHLDPKYGAQYILHHPKFSPEGETVYCNDPDGRPFATDATKFAFFSACVAQALVIGALPAPDVLHCHDWHTAFLVILLRFGFEFRSFKDLHIVFSIHNLALQGIRPFRGDISSFTSWYPDLHYSIDKIQDPRFLDCVNPMRAGILLSNRVHTVSPSYAREVVNPSQYNLGIYGGEGLENDLRERSNYGEVIGILNGCEYPKKMPAVLKKPKDIAQLMHDSVVKWAGASVVLASAHWLAEKRINHWLKTASTGFNVTFVGRLTEQKARLLQVVMPNGKTALQNILDVLGTNGTMLVLGSGDPKIEAYLVKVCADNENFVFLNGYSDQLARTLYSAGDLFFMPSSFEPCGISQLLAMRAGQPCLVNAVGGLRDTVDNLRTGFVFEGKDIHEQAYFMTTTFEEALYLYLNDGSHWQEICKAAGEARFTWDAAAQRYMDDLYSLHSHG
ncbi:MAG: glycogen synthase [Alteromonadaceae bacterium]|nr:MAG: glycogen synthase [Alteromonadaceae bacterium]